MDSMEHKKELKEPANETQGALLMSVNAQISKPELKEEEDKTKKSESSSPSCSNSSSSSSSPSTASTSTSLSSEASQSF